MCSCGQQTYKLSGSKGVYMRKQFFSAAPSLFWYTDMAAAMSSENIYNLELVSILHCCERLSSLSPNMHKINKLVSVFRICPAIDHEFCHNIK